MKLSIVLFLSTFASVAARPMPIHGKMKAGKTKSISGDLTADSILGNRILSNARRLDEDEEADFSWVTGYSLKFQGCFHVSQWNAEAEDEEDVRIMTKRLVRFRLCPVSSCDTSCDSGYGDYIIDMNTYVNSYMEAKEEMEEQACKNLEENVCDCEEGDDDQYDEDVCMSQCYADNNMSYCDKDEDGFEVNEYLECGEFEAPEDDDGNGRRLEEEEEEVQYFVGPYCSNQGGSVYLGMFTDDTCSEFADNYGGASTYSTLVGSKLPYSSTNLIGSECVSCVAEKEEQDDDQAEEEADEVSEVCNMLYQSAGKCESGLDIDEPNENGCNFMEGIKIIRKSGIVSTETPAPSKTASAFIGIFAVSFFAIGAYIYTLKSKMEKSKINLADS